MSQSDFTPDKDALDDEWIRQPELYHKYATELADARLDFEEKKNKLEVVRAELDKEIRTDPEQFDLLKVTESGISAVIVVQPEYTKALKRINTARHRIDILQAATTALDHKKKALENLVYLHGQNYFSSPRARGEESKAMDEVVRKSKLNKRGGKMTREDLREED